ncbi:hypothetical protein V3851_05880 [Paenibacillus sp. M1]|uniref:DUF1080 domain-containing protein n=1 Tax=Paenibacillus haidiansis TaxID=1574488 RepID=A0ABU7VR19_9BACL
MTKFESGLVNWHEWVIRDDAASVTSWKGHEALCLNGLAFLPDVSLSEGSIEVYVGADDVSYCGIAFRIGDVLNYELAYAQPHTSGRWDALQYDPVFHGTNTWQLYYGTGAQQAAEVPKGEWLRLRVDFKDRQAMIRVNNEAPLYIPELAHDHKEGFIGLWSYKPAYFRDFRISDSCNDIINPVEATTVHKHNSGFVEAWFLHGYGRVESEANGIVNLSRFLPETVSEANLTRKFVCHEVGEMTLAFGFSDEISIKVDGELQFAGEHKFKSSPNWADQGYVSPDRQVKLSLPTGVHQIEILIRRTEPFGFGFIFALTGGNYELMPCWDK